MDMLFDTRMDLVDAIASVTSERDLVAQTLCRIFEANSKTRQLIGYLVSKEVDNSRRVNVKITLIFSADPDVLFRGNSVATKAFDYYMKLVGLQYLNKTIGANIKDIYDSKKSCEVTCTFNVFSRSQVDPSKLEKGDNLEKNTENLISQVSQMFSSIKNGLDEFPL
jgi:hypothetical protein